MGQHEVLEFLKKNKEKWFTAREIANEIGLAAGNVCTSLNKLGRRFVNKKWGCRPMQYKYNDTKEDF